VRLTGVGGSVAVVLLGVAAPDAVLGSLIRITGLSGFSDSRELGVWTASSPSASLDGAEVRLEVSLAGDAGFSVLVVGRDMGV
jgi:hypothetical protein